MTDECPYFKLGVDKGLNIVKFHLEKLDDDELVRLNNLLKSYKFADNDFEFKTENLEFKAFFNSLNNISSKTIYGNNHINVKNGMIFGTVQSIDEIIKKLNESKNLKIG